MNRALTAIVFLFSSIALGTISIPSNLSYPMRQAINQDLGFELIAMPLGTYKPLGGYPGLELGVDYHHIDLSSLNNKQYVLEESDMNFMAFTLSKGLYYDIDLRFSATFLPQNNNMQFFSGLARWKFWENPRWFRATAEVSMSGASMQTKTFGGTGEKFNYSTQGSAYELVFSRSIGRFETFVGVGRAHSSSYFTVLQAGTNVRYPQEDEGNRYLAGGGYDWGSGKVSGGVDYIQQAKVFVQTQFELF